MASTSDTTAFAELLEGLSESVTAAESDAEIRAERSTNGKSLSEGSALPGPLSPTSCDAVQVAPAARRITGRNLLRWPVLMTSPDVQRLPPVSAHRLRFGMGWKYRCASQLGNKTTVQNWPSGQLACRGENCQSHRRNERHRYHAFAKSFSIPRTAPRQTMSKTIPIRIRARLRPTQRPRAPISREKQIQ